MRFYVESGKPKQGITRVPQQISVLRMDDKTVEVSAEDFARIDENFQLWMLSILIAVLLVLSSTVYYWRNKSELGNRYERDQKLRSVILEEAAKETAFKDFREKQIVEDHDSDHDEFEIQPASIKFEEKMKDSTLDNEIKLKHFQTIEMNEVKSVRAQLKTQSGFDIARMSTQEENKSKGSKSNEQVKPGIPKGPAKPKSGWQGYCGVVSPSNFADIEQTVSNFLFSLIFQEGCRS